MTFRIPRLVVGASAPPTHMAEFAGIMAFINKDDANKEDISLTGGQIEFTPRKTLLLPTKQGKQEFSFNAWSFDQLAGMLKIPGKYLESCPIIGKGGMKDQIEARMEERKSMDHIVRVRRTQTADGVHGIVRAILPGDYSVFDNRHLVTAVQRAIKEVGGEFNLQLSNVHDPRSIEQQIHMRFVRKEEFALAGIDDPHKIGFHCLTSEVGDGDIRVDSLVYRLLCKNGLMGWGDSEVLRLRHKNLQTHEVNPQIQEAVLASTRQEEAIKDLLERKYHEPIVDPETTLLLMGARMKASDYVKEESLKILKKTRKSEYSRYDIMQAFTEMAQTLPFAERIKLEMNVGKVMLGGGRIKATPAEETN